MNTHEASKETTPEGKIIRNETKEDGSKHVHIEVNALDVDMSDPANVKAKEYIEGQVIPALANADVLVTVIHKPTNESTSKLVKLPQVRAYAEAVVDAHIKRNHPEVSGTDPEIIALRAEYCVVENHIKDGNVKVTSL